MWDNKKKQENRRRVCLLTTVARTHGPGSMGTARPPVLSALGL